jgi:hypothetical protein
MPRKTNDLVARAEKIAGAWKSFHPKKTFCGLTLDEFIEAFRPSRDVRGELREIASRRRMLLSRRRSSDSVFRQKLIGVVHAVRGDPDVGENDPMYSAMGYVAKNRRRRPGPKKKRPAR